MAITYIEVTLTICPSGGTPQNGKMIQEPIPDWLKSPVFAKMQQIGIKFQGNDWSEPNHVLVNEYLPGQGIMPHQDGPLYQPIVATVTLHSHSILNFYPHTSNTPGNSDASQPEFSVLLEPRSLFVQTDQLYKTYLHGIAEVTEDNIETLRPINASPTDKILSRGTRISLTYRRVKNVIRNPLAKGIFKH
jgi:alkylated DNA repair protein alkB family protein 6